jgi:hypothetical protein
LKAGEQKEKERQGRIWKEVYSEGTRKRFFWVFKLQLSVRYIGRDVGEGKIEPEGGITSSKSGYRVVWWAKGIVFVGTRLRVRELTNNYQHFDPYFQIGVDTR